MTFETSRNPAVAGRFYVGTDGGFSPEQYADMLMTRLFESAKHAPQPLKSLILEWKLRVANEVFGVISEAMADAARRVGRQYELNEKKKARLLLPAGMGERLDQGGVWDESLQPM